MPTSRPRQTITLIAIEAHLEAFRETARSACPSTRCSSTAATSTCASAARNAASARLTLWKSVGDAIRTWLAVRGEAPAPELFLNAWGKP